MSPWSGKQRVKHRKVAEKVLKEPCNFLEVGRCTCVQGLEASHRGWKADNKKEVITR